MLEDAKIDTMNRAPICDKIYAHRSESFCTRRLNNIMLEFYIFTLELNIPRLQQIEEMF